MNLFFIFNAINYECPSLTTQIAVGSASRCYWEHLLHLNMFPYLIRNAGTCANFMEH